MHPFFSVIIPTYNRADVIKNTIDSVLNQFEQSFEIIIIDDYSEDITQLEQLIIRINDPRIRLIKHKVNQNGATARNSGIKAAKGNYIAFLDSDDIWPPHKLATLKNRINSPEHQSHYIYYSQVERRDAIDTPGVKAPTKGIGDFQVADYFFIYDGMIQTSTIVCHREIALSILFDERFKRHQDYDFCLRAEASSYKFIYIEEVLSYWIRDDSANPNAHVDFRLFWIKQMSDYCSKKAIYAYKISLIMPFAFEDGRYILGLKLLFQCLFRAPNFVYINSLRRTKKILLDKFFKRRKNC